MSVCVLFFGATADLVGERSIEMPLSGGETASGILQRLAAEHPQLGTHKLLLALNEEYVSPEAGLKDGDELAIFTAVSGG